MCMAKNVTLDINMQLMAGLLKAFRLVFAPGQIDGSDNDFLEMKSMSMIRMKEFSVVFEEL